MKLSDNFIYFCVIILFTIALAIFLFWTITEKMNECTSDPLKFAVNKIKSTTNAEQISGRLDIITTDGFVTEHFGDVFMNPLAP